MNISSEQSSSVDKIPELSKSFSCTKCGSIEMLDVTGITQEDIRQFKECPYICRRCLEVMYPEFYSQEHIEP